MSDKSVPANYTDMDISEAQRFDKMVKENFMPAIVSIAKQIINDYGISQGIFVDVGCSTSIFSIELSRRSNLKIYALEKVKAIYDVACMNIESQGLTDRIIPVLGDAHDLKQPPNLYVVLEVEAERFLFFFKERLCQRSL